MQNKIAQKFIIPKMGKIFYLFFGDAEMQQFFTFLTKILFLSNELICCRPHPTRSNICSKVRAYPRWDYTTQKYQARVRVEVTALACHNMELITAQKVLIRMSAMSSGDQNYQ